MNKKKRKILLLFLDFLITKKVNHQFLFTIKTRYGYMGIDSYAEDILIHNSDGTHLIKFILNSGNYFLDKEFWEALNKSWLEVLEEFHRKSSTKENFNSVW